MAMVSAPRTNYVSHYLVNQINIC